MGNCYAINQSSKTSLVCCRAKLNVTKLWHRRLHHVDYRDLVHIDNKELVRGILKLSGQPKSICGKCMKVKQVRGPHKKIQGNNTLRPLNLLCMCIESEGGKKYVLVIVDDFSRYSFVSFLREKYATIEYLKSLYTRIQLEKGHPIVRIRNIKGRKFDNVEIDHFYESNGIKHKYSTLRTPQQNVVAERKKRVL